MDIVYACVYLPEYVYETAGVLGDALTPCMRNELSPDFKIVDFDWGDL